MIFQSFTNCDSVYLVRRARRDFFYGSTAQIYRAEYYFPLGLGIGRIIFQTLNKIEIVFALLMIVTLFIKPPKTKFPVYSFGVILILLMLETFWLLPVLDARAEQVINGNAAPFSNTHFIYIAFDAIKFLLLFALGVSLTKQNLRFE